MADKIRLKQMLINLVGNAVKFTESGDIRISTQIRGAFVEFLIADTGYGIPEEEFSSIFERFKQADGSATRKAGGTGLGLAITKHLAELQGGEIFVTSAVGTGSVFRFTIPKKKKGS